MPVSKRITWVVVADGRRANVYINDGKGRALKQGPWEAMEQEIPPARDLASDKPGRAFNSVGSERSAVEQTDFHKLEKTRFLRELAQRLDQAGRSDSYDRLILVAPPTALGQLRRALSDAVRKRVHAEIDRDLTKHDLKSIEAAVETHLAG